MNIASPQEVIRIGQLEIRYLLEGADTNGALAVFAATIRSGFTPRRFAPNSPS
jgi:hypothetical protein